MGREEREGERERERERERNIDVREKYRSVASLKRPDQRSKPLGALGVPGNATIN